MSKFWSRIIRFSDEDFPKITKALRNLGGDLSRYEFDRRKGTLRVKTEGNADLSPFDSLNKKSAGEIINRALKVRIRPLVSTTVSHFSEVHQMVLSDFAERTAVGTYESNQYLSLVFKDKETKAAFRKAIKEHLPFLVVN